jgi:hypothetical protein
MVRDNRNHSAKAETLGLARLHGATTQKTAIFVLTAVRISNPTHASLLHVCADFTTCNILWTFFFVHELLSKTERQEICPVFSHPFFFIAEPSSVEPLAPMSFARHF